MPSSYQILLNGNAADADFYTAVSLLEIEENLDLPGAVQLSLPVGRTDAGDLTYVSDTRLQPMVNLAVVVTPPSGSAAGAIAPGLGRGGVSGSASGAAAVLQRRCIFDGYILSHKLHLETGNANSTLAVWGQDATWLMNLEEKVREWVNVTDADVANAIFGEYGITPASGQPDGRLAFTSRVGAESDAAWLRHSVP